MWVCAVVLARDVNRRRAITGGIKVTSSVWGVLKKSFIPVSHACPVTQRSGECAPLTPNAECSAFGVQEKLGRRGEWL